MDIRLNVDFFSNIKTLKLERLTGAAGIKSLLTLWTYAAKNRPNGKLVDMGPDEIELAAGWAGEAGTFFNALVDLRFLDEDGAEGTYIYSLHEWLIHNPWIASSEQRGNQNRFIRLAGVCPEAYSALCGQGVTELTKEQYYQAIAQYSTPRRRNVDAPSTLKPEPEPYIYKNDHDQTDICTNNRTLSTYDSEQSHASDKPCDSDQPADQKDQNEKLKTMAYKISTPAASPMVRTAAKGLLLQNYLSFLSLAPTQTQNRERRESENSLKTWAESLTPYLIGLDINKEFVEMTAWVNKKHFTVRNCRAFVTKWFKRVHNERINK